MKKYKLSNNNKKIFWLEKDINSYENDSIRIELRKSFINVSFFDNINDILFEIKCNNFHLIYIIVYASIFRKFINEFKKLKNEISVAPKIIIYNYSLFNPIDFHEEINDSFYDCGGIVFDFSDIKSFINKKLYEFNPNFYNYINTLSEDTNFTFQVVKHKDDLIGPTFISELILTPRDADFKIFDKYLMENYGEEMIDLISQIYEVNCPYSIRMKYWLRAYTLESNFYKKMKVDLMKEKTKDYLPYIKLLYYGLENNYINFNFSKDLFRGAGIEYSEIENLLVHKNKKIKSSFRFIIL